MNQLSRTIIAIATLALANAALAVQPWTCRVRATYLQMANESDAFSALGINFPSGAVHVNSKWIPEFDISYNFSEQFSAELVLTIPQTQEVTLAGVGKLGTFKHLPPHLLAQYHFLAPSEKFQPYIGAGLNFTLIWGGDLKVANVPLSLDSSSLGLSAQCGFDYDLGNSKYINVDVKKTMLSSDVSAGGARLTTAKLNPWIISVGYGWKF